MAFCNSSAGESGFAAGCLDVVFLSFGEDLPELAGLGTSWLSVAAGMRTYIDASTTTVTSHRMLPLYIAARSKLRSRLQTNAARYGMDLHSASRSSHASAKTVLVLIFDHDRDSSANVPRHGLGRQMEIRRRRNADLDRSGCSLQAPVAVAGRIALHRDSP